MYISVNIYSPIFCALQLGLGTTHWHVWFKQCEYGSLLWHWREFSQYFPKETWISEVTKRKNESSNYKDVHDTFTLKYSLYGVACPRIQRKLGTAIVFYEIFDNYR